MARFEEAQQLFSKNNITAQYRNYPDVNFKNSLQLYYGTNLERLKAVKKTYDPNNVLQHEQSIWGTINEVDLSTIFNLGSFFFD